MTHLKRILVVIAATVAPALLQAQTAPVSEDFTGATTANSWYFFNGACLTAGATTSAVSPGQIPSCVSIGASYYNQNLVGGANGVSGSTQTLPDPVGSGALRFTNGYPYGYAQNGAIVSNYTFPTNQGVQITFKTVTYRGDSGSPIKDGADGISFYLMDGSQPAGIGAWGGSLAYSCSNSNTPHDGLVGAYIGLGIDEYGNFLNGTKLMSGYTGSNTATGDNSALGYGYYSGRIGLRGAGNVAWSWLNAKYPILYPSSLSSSQQQDSVYRTCRDGVLWDYSSASSPKQAKASGSTIPVMDYAPIPNAYSELQRSGTGAVQIAAESAMKRGVATPIFYNLKITQDGLLSFSYSINGGAYKSVIDKQSITASNASGALPASFRFGFAGSTGGSTNIHEIMCFKAAPVNEASSSTGVNEKQSAKIEAGIQAYFAYYDPNNWTGRLTANSLGLDSSNNVVVSSTANWDASCVLSGVGSTQTCTTTGVAGPSAAESPSTRQILTWDGSKGVGLQYTNLATDEKTALDAGDSKGTKRVSYFRGVRTDEYPSGAGFRPRDGVLGDIIDSSPTWVGPPQSPYTSAWRDRLYPSATVPETSATQSYLQFISTYQTRLNVVYAGGNDGMLHGFRTGSFDSGGNYVNGGTTPNDGQEVLAYMPRIALNSLHSSTDSTVDFTNTQYGHDYFVDGTPGTGDLFYGGTWHTWLVGGMGAGGAAIFALDITNPSASTFTESNAQSLVIGEWTAGSDSTAGAIVCTNVSNCGRNLGNTYGIPQIRRFHNGAWGAVFGNGLGSSTADAGIYIMIVDPTSGAKTFYYLSTGTSGTNGIAYVAPTDLDGDHVVDYVYAGDLLGNLWRFDLTDTNPANWSSGGSPVFKTPAGQPITTRVVAASGPGNGGPNRLMIAFGTGQKTPLTNTNPVTYLSATQDLYGVWDWNLNAWNARSSAKYASLAATATATGLSSPYTVQKVNLQQQTITIDPTTHNRDILANSTVCFQGATVCGGGLDNKFGWYLDLPGSSSQGSEQIVFNPQLLGSALVINSTVPADNVPTSCTVNTDKGFTYAVSMMSGGALTKFFPQYHDTIVDANTGSNIAGIQTDATGTSFPVQTASGDEWLVYQTVENIHKTTKINIPVNTVGKRLTWIELR